ncbi:hypothetical protein D3C73_1091220 [compost metagenome]
MDITSKGGGLGSSDTPSHAAILLPDATYGYTYFKLYFGGNGNNSILGKGGLKGGCQENSTSENVILYPPQEATGYGSGGAGGNACSYQHQTITNAYTYGTKGSPGFVRISW